MTPPASDQPTSSAVPAPDASPAADTPPAATSTLPAPAASPAADTPPAATSTLPAPAASPAPAAISTLPTPDASPAPAAISTLPAPDDITNILRGVIDPELGSDIVDLGMLKDVSIAADGTAKLINHHLLALRLSLLRAAYRLEDLYFYERGRSPSS